LRADFIRQYSRLSLKALKTKMMPMDKFCSWVLRESPAAATA
jgi:hypothetical protein